MRRVLPAAMLGLALTPALAIAGATAFVTNGNNEGPGSLRAALESGANKIVIDQHVGAITVTETLEYSGTEGLRLVGSGQTIDGAGLIDRTAPVMAVTEGADLSMSNLTIDAGGMQNGAPYSRLNQGGGKGLFVDVPVTRAGTVRVRLTHVTVIGTGNHGIHVSDCSLGDDCGGGSGGGGDGSPASIDIRLNSVHIDNSGNGKQDADGLRVDDRGDGDIVFVAKNSIFSDVGADGVELDEGNNGSVYAYVRDTTFYANGEYCNDGPDPTEDEPCFDEIDDGEVVRDVDDGFDIDEAGPGSLLGRIVDVGVLHNFDEGLDFDEEDEGDTNLRFVRIYSAGNEDEGIKVSEEDDGDNVVRLYAVTTDGDLEFEEEDFGVADIAIFDSTVDERMQIEADDGDPTTTDGFYKERGSTVSELDFEGDIVIL